jgi:hypothetical protein
MSPQQKGTNWTIVALVISTAITVWYTGRATGKIENSITVIEQRLDRRDAKDESQDGRLLGHDISLSVITTDVTAIKEGRYPPSSPRTPIFSQRRSPRVGVDEP